MNMLTILLQIFSFVLAIDWPDKGKQKWFECIYTYK